MTWTYIALCISLLINVLACGWYLYIRQSKNDGALDIEEFPDGAKRYSLNLETELDAIDAQKTITLKINKLS